MRGCESESESWMSVEEGVEEGDARFITIVVSGGSGSGSGR